MGRFKMELQVMGNNLPLFSGAVIAVFIFLALTSGELINFSCVCFEVVFPFFTAIAVGEWGRTRSDVNYDVIAAQSRSLFHWVLMRCLAVWSICSLFAVGGLTAVFFIRREMTIAELFCIYFPTAFLFSSLAVLAGLLHVREHVAALVSGLVWLVFLMLSSLLRLPGMVCLYPFIRFAGVDDTIWLVNKGIQCLIGLVLWGAIYWICRNKNSGV